MKVVEKNFGTSILRTRYVSLSNFYGIVFTGSPIVVARENEQEIEFIVYDTKTLDGIFMSFKFAKVPTHTCALHCAARIIAHQLFSILHDAGITELQIFVHGDKPISSAAKSGFALLKKLGIKIK